MLGQSRTYECDACFKNKRNSPKIYSRQCQFCQYIIYDLPLVKKIPYYLLDLYLPRTVCILCCRMLLPSVCKLNYFEESSNNRFSSDNKTISFTSSYMNTYFSQNYHFYQQSYKHILFTEVATGDCPHFPKTSSLTGSIRSV